MTIQTIIKKAIKRIELEGKLLTPDFYAEAFCKELTKAGMNLEDCSHVSKYSSSLSKEFQKELLNYRVTTLQEFTRYLVARLNRTNPSQCIKLVESQVLFIKRVLSATLVLHNKDVSNLAKKSIDLLNQTPTNSQIEQFSQLWQNFTANYDDTFLQKLNDLGDVDTKDLKSTILGLNIPKNAQSNDEEVNLSRISSLIISSLVPSIASSANDEIIRVSKMIKSKPSSLDEKDTMNEIKSMISLRIALDKESVKEMVESIDGVLDRLSLKLIDLIEKSDNSTTEIQKIKLDLEKYGDVTGDFKSAHKKLYTIATALEENTKMFSKDLKTNSGEVQYLSAKIAKLESDLEVARKESKEDFLTKLYNRKALDEFLELKEAEFKRYKRNYCILMFDLDLFKKVNDTYGHDAGDAVLVAFAKILKHDVRTVDIVGRFGGEEFVAILSETQIDGAVILAQKIREHVSSAKFMYRGKRINVTVSIGVAERAKNVTGNATLLCADEHLYKAKENGRNRVSFSN